jgi:hypothetical protein
MPTQPIMKLSVLPWNMLKARRLISTSKQKENSELEILMLKIDVWFHFQGK